MAENAPYGDVTYADPGYQDDNRKRYPVDTKDHVRAAWVYIHMANNTQPYTAEQVSQIKDNIRAAAKQLGVELADDSAPTSQRAEIDPQPAPLYNREAVVSDVDFAQRLITTIAVPYGQSALVPGGMGFGKPGEVWKEIFCRSAFNGVEAAPHRVRVNRDHNRSRTVGKVIAFEDRADGLVSTVRIAKTSLGDETLALADEKCLGASVSFRCGRSDQELDRFTLTRRVKRAYMDHLSFVENPAYDGAQVLSVREDLLIPEPAAPTSTPTLDAFIADPVLQWAMNRIQQ